MKTKKRYYAISETDNNNLNMGVISASGYEELMEKIDLVCGNHFCDDPLIIDFSAAEFEQLKYGIERNSKVFLANEENEQLITICLTCLY